MSADYALAPASIGNQQEYFVGKTIPGQQAKIIGPKAIPPLSVKSTPPATGDQIMALARIGRLTIELLAAQQGVKTARDKFADSCAKWKKRRGHDAFISKASPDWERLVKGCAKTYKEIFAAKATVYNVRRRIATAVRRAEWSAA